MIDREAIYGGFWNALVTATNAAAFNTRSRRLKHWVDTPGVEQPALFQTVVRETSRASTGQPTKWEFGLKLYVYAYWNDGDEAFPLNPLLDAVTNYINLRHPITGRHPLCMVLPKVETIHVDGTIETDEGVLGAQQIAIIPVTITATDSGELPPSSSSSGSSD